MKNIFKNFLNKYWPIFLLLIITTIIGLTNYQKDKWLVGWDNNIPNLNFSENFERNIFGIWQEDRGLGLPDGMSHIANLVHTTSVFLLSFIFPNNYLRFVYHLLMLFIGGSGTYFLIKKLIDNKLASLLGSMFIMLNLSTLQMFHLPLAVFSVHFAFLPWLTLSLLKLLHKPNSKNSLIFFILSFLASPQGYVPTIFGVYLLSFFTIIIFQFTLTKKYFKSAILAGLILLTSNAFWIIPYSFNLTKSLDTISNATINVMSNESIRFKNKEYGDLESVVIGKGLYLSFYEEEEKPLMQPWISHIEQQEIKTISWVVWGISLLGLVSIIFKRKKKMFPFVVLYSISFLLLGNNISYLSNVLNSINFHVPVFANAYRFIFTKFSILHMFSYSILFAFGLKIIFSKIKYKLVKNIIFVLSAGALIFLAKPSFQESFFSQDMMLYIPNKYFQLQKFFEKQPTTTRVHILPQPNFWGWTFYDWGFKGSGFIWQILPQATMDGAFLPWSESNESYYLEINQSLISKDVEAFDNTLIKYQIDWIIIDESITDENKTINLESTFELINNSKVLKKEKEIENIKIYSNTQATHKNFIFSPKNLSLAESTCLFCRKDTAFAEKRHYLNKKTAIHFPFQYLSSERDIENNISQNNTNNSLSLLPKLNNFSEENYTIKVPNLIKNENYTFPIKVSNKNKQIKIELYYPYNLLLEKKNLFNPILVSIEKDIQKEYPEYIITIGEKQITILNNNQEFLDSIDLKIQDELLIELFGINESNSKLLISEPIDELIKTNTKKIEAKEYKFKNDEKLEVSILANELKLDFSNSNKTFNCNENERGSFNKTVMNNTAKYFTTDKSTLCDIYGLNNLSYNTGYLLNFEGNNNYGKNLEFFVHNWATDKIDIESVFPEGEFSQFYTLLPQKNIIGKGYSVNFRLNSFKNTDSESLLKTAKIYSLPIDLLTQIELIPEGYEELKNDTVILNSKHLSPVLYKIEISSIDDGHFSLLQGYDSNWIALSQSTKKPWWDINSYLILPHYKLNNWANTWETTAGEYSISIIYWPQIITITGYGILIGTSIYFGTTIIKKSKNPQKNLIIKPPKPNLKKKIQKTMKGS